MQPGLLSRKMKESQSGESWQAGKKTSRSLERKLEEEGNKGKRGRKALSRDRKLQEESKAVAREDDLKLTNIPVMDNTTGYSL